MKIDSEDQAKPQIDFGHFGAILACAVLLVGITFFKTGFKLFPNRTGDNNLGLKAEALSDSGFEREPQASAQSNQEFYNQLSMIDPNFGGGSVLGLSTTTAESFGYPKPEDVFTKEVMDSLPLKISDDSSLLAIENYKLIMDDPLVQNEIANLLSILSQDNSRGLEIQRDNLVKQLLSVEVPKPLAEYHRLNIFYYYYLVEGYKQNLKPANEPDEFGTDVVLVAISQRLPEIKELIKSQYGVDL